MDKRESLLKQREEAKKEVAQYENQVKILLNKQRNAERHARNHRLIVHGAIMEGVFPFTASIDGEQAAAETPQGGGSLVTRLYEAQAQVNSEKARSRTGKIKAFQENAKLLAFLQGNGITSMQELYEKVTVINKDYYDLRGQIVKAERCLVVLDERLEMCAQYDRCKAVRQRLDKVKPRKREQYQQEHRAELADFEAAEHFLKELKSSGEAITPKAWRAEAAKLTMQKDADYQKMRAMRDEIKAVEALRKAADRLAHEGQHQQRETER